MAANLIKQHNRGFKVVYKSGSKSSNATTAVPARGRARIPVFMLPHNRLLAIPEESEIREGFCVRTCEQPHQERRFLGLMSLSYIDERAMARSATTAVEFKSFSTSTVRRPPPKISYDYRWLQWLIGLNSMFDQFIQLAADRAAHSLTQETRVRPISKCLFGIVTSDLP